MVRTEGTTTIHKSGIAKEVTSLLMNKAPRDGFKPLCDKIQELYEVEVSPRQLQYFNNNYVLPKKVITPKDAINAVNKQRELIDVIVEQMDLLEMQRKRLGELYSLDEVKLMEEHNGKIIDPEKSEPRSLWYFIREKAKMIREEITTMAYRIDELKEMKQELGLLSKEPERLHIESKTESEFGLKDLDEDTIKELALALARQ